MLTQLLTMTTTHKFPSLVTENTADISSMFESLVEEEEERKTTKRKRRKLPDIPKDKKRNYIFLPLLVLNSHGAFD